LCLHFTSQIHPENQPWQTLNVFLVFTHDDTWFGGLSTIRLPYFAREMVLRSSPWSFPIASPAAIHHCQWPSPSRHRHYHYNNDTMYKQYQYKDNNEEWCVCDNKALAIYDSTTTRFQIILTQFPFRSTHFDMGRFLFTDTTSTLCSIGTN
jgi:hypothetical protein